MDVRPDVQIFKWPKNRKDGSKFDDFRTKRIVSARPISGKIFERTKRMKSFRKIRKFFKKIFEKFFGKFLAYIRDASLNAMLTALYDLVRLPVNLMSSTIAAP